MAKGRKMKDWLLVAFSASSMAIVAFPLIHIILTTAMNGIRSIDPAFLASLPKPPGEAGGGIAHAIQGSLILAALTMAISIPSSLMIAIYLAEYRDRRFGEILEVVNDAFTGTPSIVAGVFIYSFVVLRHGFSALAGAMALSILAIPNLVRIFGEALKLVPLDLRMAGLALGAPRWRVIIHIVLGAAMPSIASGTLLILARVMGETAPLLFTAFGSNRFAYDILHPVSAIPLVIYTYATSPYTDWHGKAWGAALILMLLVLAINLLVRYSLRGRG
ncbi:MAG: phosphate ABC transporter permease PstA [Candidatus Bathyarchaeia archaeon]